MKNPAHFKNGGVWRLYDMIISLFVIGAAVAWAVTARTMV